MTHRQQMYDLIHYIQKHLFCLHMTALKLPCNLISDLDWRVCYWNKTKRTNKKSRRHKKDIMYDVNDNAYLLPAWRERLPAIYREEPVSNDHNECHTINWTEAMDFVAPFPWLCYQPCCYSLIQWSWWCGHVVLKTERPNLPCSI